MLYPHGTWNDVRKEHTLPAVYQIGGEGGGDGRFRRGNYMRCALRTQNAAWLCVWVLRDEAFSRLSSRAFVRGTDG